jgi:hypothetical protein
LEGEIRQLDTSYNPVQRNVMNNQATTLVEEDGTKVKGVVNVVFDSVIYADTDEKSEEEYPDQSQEEDYEIYLGFQEVTREDN